jgi:uncharacterized protein (TIGR02147 family)
MESRAAPHYKDFLEREYEMRQRRNSAYSLRAFARDLGMQPSKLSEVFHGIRGLSRKTGEKIVKKMKLSPHECSVFLNLIDFHQNRSRVLKRRAEENLRVLNAVDAYSDLSLEKFKIISDWYHFAILELTEVYDFESDPGWIAGRLGISTKTATEAIERLLEFGLLKRTKSGKLIQSHLNLATPSGIPSRELREHHSQILMKADNALHEVDLSERDFSAITLAFGSEQMDVVRNELKELRRRLGQTIQEKQKKDRVYCLSIQFFPLDKNTNETKVNEEKLV